MHKGLISLLLLIFCFQLNGQNSTTQISQNLSVSSLAYFNYSEIPSDCVSVDADEKTLFIDLEKIQYNLKEISLIDHDGSIAFVKDVTQSPVDAIVEIDLKELTTGSYLLELKSYVNSLHKRIEI